MLDSNLLSETNKILDNPLRPPDLSNIDIKKITENSGNLGETDPVLKEVEKIRKRLGVSSDFKNLLNLQITQITGVVESLVQFENTKKSVNIKPITNIFQQSIQLQQEIFQALGICDEQLEQFLEKINQNIEGNLE